MCGIAGIYNSKHSFDQLNQIAKKIVTDLNHRGPDGHGIKILNDNNKLTLLAHTRLSIIDLRDVSNQPMSYADQSYWIIFNGEIYNYKELKQELQTLGQKFSTQSDTEVILAAYQQWGLNGFNKFLGMWALAIWDKVNDQFVLSRDRLGKKPLYFSFNQETLCFASEPKAIIPYLDKKAELNPKAVSDYFSYRYVLENQSFFKNINSVPAGCHIVFKNKVSKIIRYWELPVYKNKVDIGEFEAKKLLTNLLESAVNYRMISDVPLGAFLSGGLDSSIIVALMAQRSSRPIKTYTIGFEEKGFNEFEYARAVAKHLGTEHKEIVLSVDNYLDYLVPMIKIKDAPLAVPNEIALYQLSKILKKDISVVISGEGADELFGGYGRIFRSAYDYQRVSSGNLSSELEENLKSKYGNLNLGTELNHFLGQYSYMNFSEKTDLFNSNFYSALGSDPRSQLFFKKYWDKLDGLDLAEKYMWIFQKVHLEGLLGRLDSSTMSASVEGRSPFVDHRLIEAISALPLKYKMKWKSDYDHEMAKNLNSDQISENNDITKYLLRSTYSHLLPEIISERKKVGFPVPLGEWLSGPLREYARSRLSESNAKTKEIFNSKYVEKLLTDDSKNHNKGLQLWMMVNVEEWMRCYGINY